MHINDIIPTILGTEVVSIDKFIANFSISRELWEEFKRKAEEDNTTASDLLKMFIDRFVRGDIQRSFVVRQTFEEMKEAQSSND